MQLTFPRQPPQKEIHPAPERPFLSISDLAVHPACPGMWLSSGILSGTCTPSALLWACTPGRTLLFLRAECPWQRWAMLPPQHPASTHPASPASSQHPSYLSSTLPTTILPPQHPPSTHPASPAPCQHPYHLLSSLPTSILPPQHSANIHTATPASSQHPSCFPSTLPASILPPQHSPHLGLWQVAFASLTKAEAEIKIAIFLVSPAAVRAVAALCKPVSVTVSLMYVCVHLPTLRGSCVCI